MSVTDVPGEPNRVVWMDKNHPRSVFIASPLFNREQVLIIRRIERMLTGNGFSYYSARQDSGSYGMTKEQMRDFHAWDPVYNSNERGLDRCKAMIAVLEYAMPRGQRLQLVREDLDLTGDPEPVRTIILPSMELPDAGTVFECGYFRAQMKPVIGFHSTKQAKHLNLMLSHGCDGLISGWENLERFLRRDHEGSVAKHDFMSRLAEKGRDPQIVNQFDWSACENWDREVE